MKKLLLTGLPLWTAFILLHCASGNPPLESYSSKDYSRTLALCKQTLQTDSTNTESILLMAKVYTELDSFPQADAALQRALQLKSEDPGLYQKVSDLYFQLYERTPRNLNALEYLQKAEALSPESTEVLDRLGAFYEKSGELEQAKARYEKLIMLVKDPTQYGFIVNTLENKIQFAKAAYFKGVQTYQNQKYDEAMQLFIKAIEAYPGMNEAVYYLNLSKALTLKRNPNKSAREQARINLLAASEAEPDKAEPHFLMGQFYEMENDKNFLDEAIHHYALSCKLEPAGPFAIKSRDKVKSLKKKKETLDKFWNRGLNP